MADHRSDPDYQKFLYDEGIEVGYKKKTGDLLVNGEVVKTRQRLTLDVLPMTLAAATALGTVTIAIVSVAEAFGLAAGCVGQPPSP